MKKYLYVKTSYVLLLGLLLAFNSCSSDDDEDSGLISESQLVGTWQLSSSHLETKIDGDVILDETYTYASGEGVSFTLNDDATGKVYYPDEPCVSMFEEYREILLNGVIGLWTCTYADDNAALSIYKDYTGRVIEMLVISLTPTELIIESYEESYQNGKLVTNHYTESYDIVSEKNDDEIIIEKLEGIWQVKSERLILYSYEEKVDEYYDLFDFAHGLIFKEDGTCLCYISSSYYDDDMWNMPGSMTVNGVNCRYYNVPWSYLDETLYLSDFYNENYSIEKLTSTELVLFYRFSGEDPGVFYEGHMSFNKIEN